MGADDFDGSLFVFPDISIHGPRVGADAVHALPELLGDISIHGPRVGADISGMPREYAKEAFQSTAPVWGPT